MEHPKFDASFAVIEPLRDSMGLTFERMDADGIDASWDATPEGHQPYGILHGGVHCMVVEGLCSMAAALWLGDDGRVVGVNNSTDFYRAVSEGRLALPGPARPPRPLAAGLDRRDGRRRREARRAWPGPAAEPALMRLEEVGDHAESLAGVKRKGHEGRIAWYVDNRLVVRQHDADTLVVRSDFEERERLVDAHPDTFSVPPHLEAHMKVEADLVRGDPDAIRTAITAAWELQRR